MVPRRLTSLALLALLTASAPIGAQVGRQFVPLVQPTDTVASCEHMPGGAVQQDERGFLLRFSEEKGVSHVVSAVWDTSGHLRRYSDTRGDLRGPPVPRDERGPRTTIVIDFSNRASR